ncbi:MAG: MATE family efflux transporter, partial [Clostridiales bacterium]|nr:MATE family efflux transporter [Clostridiales bacterium]
MGASAKKNKQYGMDLTRGPEQKVLLRFAFPFLVSSIIIALYGAVDMFVISYFTSEEIISGVSTGTMVLAIISTFIVGITTGGTVLVGCKTGEKDNEGCARAAGTLMTAGLIMGIALTIAVYETLEPFLNVLFTPEAAMPSARVYIKLVAIGIPFNVGFNIISAIARGLGNSMVPSVIGSIGGALNIALDLIFVGIFGMAADGVAIATTVSQIVAFVIIGVWLLKRKFPFKFTK